MERNPNNKELLYEGYKLSNVEDENIEISQGYVVIGSEDDDTSDPYRVTLTVIDDSDKGHYVIIDLEDVLRASVAKCKRLYERVLQESEEVDNGDRPRQDP